VTTIAFCGLGMMGTAMATRLREAGHDVRAWNRSPEKARAWAAGGGVASESPEVAAQGASEAHLMVADDAAVEAIIFGPHGLIAGLKPQSLVVDHSTVSVAGTKDRAGRLIDAGFRYLHGPVFAGPPQVAKGEGLMLIGGDKKTYAQGQVTLHQILAKHFVIGEKPEDAAAFKLMGNSMLVSINEGLAEFFAIATASGITPQRAFSLFEAFDVTGTISRRGPRMVAGDYKPPTFTLSLAHKDVQLMLQAASGRNVPALRAIEEKMKRLIAQGYGDLDMSALAVDVSPQRGGAH
jgi:3-hydroxyisobutyrate dehydrogenase